MDKLLGKMVKVRFKKYFLEQHLWVLLGRVLTVSENWVAVEGKGIVTARFALRGESDRYTVDKEPRVLVIPWDNIAHIRILPDTFSLDKIEIVNHNGRDFVKVPGAPETSIGEEV